jgi:predicted ABC-type ATPase
LDKPSLKKIIIIAGPNGAGKTTFARDFLPAEAQTLRFINADLIAAGLAPFNPESAAIKAGRRYFGFCWDIGHRLTPQNSRNTVNRKVL